MPRLQGRTAIITGGARGIGRASAELFAREGATVYVTDIAAPSEAFEHPSIKFSAMDVSNEDQWTRLVAEISRAHGAVDVLLNNAGVGGTPVALAEETLADWKRVLDINLTGVFLGMRAVIPGMQAKKGGSIVNVSSIWGVAAVPAFPAYHASKAGVRNLSKHAAVAYAAAGIRVNSLHPGIIATPLVTQQPDGANAAVIAATPLGRMGRPEEIANGALFLASDESSFMTGAELVLDGGYLAQ